MWVPSESHHPVPRWPKRVGQEPSEDDFKVQKAAVHQILAEKDINLQKEEGRFWSEISTHKYLFDRQEKELEILASLTLDDFKNHFETVFFSEKTKRIDLELTAEAHKEEQATCKASNADHEGHKHIKRQTFD